MQQAVHSKQCLTFVKAEGTSATSAAHFALCNSTVAYIVGSGVVVTVVSAANGIESQRFFVANNLDNPSSTHNVGDYDTQRDLFGLPTYSMSHYIGSLLDSGLDRLSLLDIPKVTQGSKLKEKVRTPTCVALSPNGRILAVGETGYQPRVLLYSLAPDSSGLAFATINEHAFGVKHLAFSPDLKFLASLGTMTDGFLHVWKLSPLSVQLKATNRCSAMVNDLIWHDNGTGDGLLITAGLRFVRVWSLDSCERNPQSKAATLKGRNVILGKYLDGDYQQVISLSKTDIVVRDHCQLFLLSTEDRLNIKPVSQNQAGFCGIHANSEQDCLVYFDQDLNICVLNREDLNVDPNCESNARRNPASKSSSDLLSLSIASNTERESVTKGVKLGNTHGALLTHNAYLIKFDYPSSSQNCIARPLLSSIAGCKKAYDGDIVVFSKNGCIKTFSSGISQHQDEIYLLQEGTTPTELTALDKHENTYLLGNKNGVVTIQGGTATEPIFTTKAHTLTVNDIIFFELGSIPMLCSISRDRMIQLFGKINNSWDLMQTIAVHAGNLLCVKSIESCIYVCSADRSISVHEIEVNSDTEPCKLIVYQRKILPLRSTPIHMEIDHLRIIVSTNDKTISVYNRNTFEMVLTHKVMSDNGEALNVDRFVIRHHQIVSWCSDKSIRIIHLTDGFQQGCVWGHMSPVIGLLEEDQSLKTLDVDGILFHWNINTDDHQSTRRNYITAQPPNDHELEKSLPGVKVVRKILPTYPAASTPLLSPSPQRNLSLSMPDLTTHETSSPTPRLSHATIRRLEARKSADLQVSPCKPGVGEPSRKIRPNLPMISPSRRSSATGTQSDQRSRASLFATGTSGISPKNHQSRSTAALSERSKEHALTHVGHIKSLIAKGSLDDGEKLALKSELEDLIYSLGYTTSTYDALLARYSDDILAMLRGKKNGIDFN